MRPGGDSRPLPQVQRGPGVVRLQPHRNIRAVGQGELVVSGLASLALRRFAVVAPASGHRTAVGGYRRNVAVAGLSGSLRGRVRPRPQAAGIAGRHPVVAGAIPAEAGVFATALRRAGATGVAPALRARGRPLRLVARDPRAAVVQRSIPGHPDGAGGVGFGARGRHVCRRPG